MNFRRILSKSSSRSTVTSGRSASNNNEVDKLQSEIESLIQTVEALKVSVESRDAAIGTLAREKEKLYVELKSVQRTNRNLHQQLVDERDIYAKEKEFYSEEIKRLSRKNEYDNINQDGPSHDCACNSYKQEIKAKDEVIYNIGCKYLKMKASKQSLMKKLEALEMQSQKVCDNIVGLLQENKRYIDNLMNKLIRSSDKLSVGCKNYFKLLKLNADLHYENTQLKIELSKRKLNDGVKDEVREHGDNQKQTTSYEMPKFAEKSATCRSKKKILVCHRSPHYKKRKTIGKNTNFQSFHELYSSHFKRKITRYNSDPCIFRNN